MFTVAWREKTNFSVTKYAFVSAIFSILPVSISSNSEEALFPTLLFSLVCLFLSFYGMAQASLPVRVDLKKTHLIQAGAQLGFLIIWGLCFHQVFIRLPLLLSQIFIAISTQLLIDIFSRRPAKISLEFFPMVFSLNFFLWFFPAYYWASICLVVFGVLGKNIFVRSSKGNPKHLFNPSGFSMALAVYLIASFGINHTSRFFLDAPSTMYLIPYAPVLIFLLSLAPLLLAGTVAVSLGALFGFFFMGMPGFLDTSTFLAMSLLVTDPSTAPKNRFIQFAYGFVYYLSIFYTEPFFGPHYDAPFFAKVAALPLLNFSVPYLNKLKLDFFPNFLNRTWVTSLAFFITYAIVFSLTWHHIGNPLFEQFPPFTVRFFRSAASR